MTKIRLPYVVRVRGNLFWQPTAKMRAAGFHAKPLGAEGPETIAEARRLYDAWMAHRLQKPQVTTYPGGSLGAYFDRFTGRLSKKPSRRWERMAPKTREDYHRAWKHLEPRLARTTLTAIGVEDCERLVDEVEETFGHHERYRTLKVLRALYADAIVRLRLNIPSPAKGVPNPQPKGRSAIWLGAEVAKLIRAAEGGVHPGMGLAIRISWDTLFSPADVWSLRAKNLKRDETGWYLHRGPDVGDAEGEKTGRTKTGKEAFGCISAETAEVLLAYMKAQPIAYLPDTPIIRQRNGHAYRSKDTFGDDFRDVRKAAFGKEETRKFLDLRRSGNVEADAAGADKATMAEIMANTMNTSKFLSETYTPPTVAKARDVALQRLIGRQKLAGESARVVGSN